MNRDSEHEGNYISKSNMSMLRNVRKYGKCSCWNFLQSSKLFKKLVVQEISIFLFFLDSFDFFLKNHFFIIFSKTSDWPWGVMSKFIQFESARLDFNWTCFSIEIKIKRKIRTWSREWLYAYLLCKRQMELPVLIIM